uniref:histidine kinase n=1 Tax=Caldilinea aerophila TaxID=133453 RepID=A0A7C1FW67_9CHLR
MNAGQQLAVQSESIHSFRKTTCPMPESSPGSETLFKILDALPIEVAALNRQGEIIYVNPMWRAFACANGAPGDFLGVNYLHICRQAQWSEPFAASVADAIERALVGEGTSTPLLYPCPDEHRMRWFRMDVVPVQWMEEVAALVLHQEVGLDNAELQSQIARFPTQEKGASEHRFNSAQWLHMALEAIKAGLWEWDIQTGKVFWSPESYKLFGMPQSAKNLSYDVWWGSIHPEDRQAVDEAVRRAVEECRDLVDLEFRIVLPDGTVRWMKDRGRMILDETGQPVRMIGIQMDITEQKEVAVSLEEERILLRTVIDALPLALYVKDRQARKILTNSTDLLFLGVNDPAEVLGKTDLELFNDVCGYTCYLEDLEVLRTGQPVIQREAEMVNSRGEHRHILLSKTPLRNRNQEIIGLVGVTEDITERKRLETQLYEAQKMESLGAIAATVAHDFYNLLTPIIGLSEVLFAEAPPNSRQRKYLEQILSASYKARNLLKQMQTFSRLQEADARKVDLVNIVAEACDIHRSALPPHITLYVHLKLASATLHADPTQLHQAIMNLLVNAQQAIGESVGEITVIVGCEAAQSAYRQPHAYVKVIDTGQGIDAATRKRIFEPFFTTKRGSGSGLGLAIVQRVVRSLGGSIEVESEPGKGATFTVILPVIEIHTNL